MPIEKHDDLSWSEYEDMDCPLCMEHFEYDEINFFPCNCGYQICKFCFDRIGHHDDPVQRICPACRAPYTDEPALAEPISETLKDKLELAKRNGGSSAPTNIIISTGGGLLGDVGTSLTAQHLRQQTISDNRRHLTSVRVLQKNLVFIVGLSPSLAREEILKKYEWFGKYGTIKKVAINTHTSSYGGIPGKPMTSASAYLTYSTSDEALRAIMGGNGQYCDGRTLKCSLGTTKYCSRFLRNQDCTLSDCMYLHEVADHEASFTKNDMNLGLHTDYEHSLMENFKQRERESQARRLVFVKSRAKPSRAPVTRQDSNVADKRAIKDSNNNDEPTSAVSSSNPWNVPSPKPTRPEKVSTPPLQLVDQGADIGMEQSASVSGSATPNTTKKITPTKGASEKGHKSPSMQAVTPSRPQISEVEAQLQEEYSKYQSPLIDNGENRKLGQSLNLKWYGPRYEDSEHEQRLSEEWNSIVNMLNSSEGIQEVRTNNTTTLKDKLLYLGSEIIPIACVYSRRNRPKISQIMEEMTLQMNRQNKHEQHNMRDADYYPPLTPQNSVNNDWSMNPQVRNMKPGHDKAQWGAWRQTQSNGAPPPGLMRSGY